MTTTIRPASVPQSPRATGSTPQNGSPLPPLKELSVGDTFAELLDDVNLGAALEALQKGLISVTRRLTGHAAEREFTRYEVDEDATPGEYTALAAGDERATIPALMKSAQRLTTLVQAVQSRLDGTLTEAYRTPGKKFELLGIPEGRDGYRGADHLLQDTVNISSGEARRRTQTAQHFQPHRPPATDGTESESDTAGTQGRLARLFPLLTAAYHEARIGQAHLHQLVYAVNAIDRQARICGHLRSEAESRYRTQDAELTDKALTTSFAEFQRYLYAWRSAVLTDLAPDAADPDEERIHARRGLNYTGVEGGLKVWTLGTDNEGHELLSCIRGAANNPRQRVDDTTLDPTLLIDDDDDDADRIHDGRTPTQRAHDGLMAVLSAGLQLKDNGLPDQGGARPQIIVTAGLTALLKIAHTSGLLPGTFNTELLTGGSTRDLLISAGYTGPTGAGMLRRLVCTAEITTAVLGAEGEVLDVASSRRQFSLKQRRALAARDGGCAAPGCTFPAAWCDSHHVQEWSEGGPTTVENGVLLCNHHHRSLHLGMWVIEMHDGVPWFTPTAKLRPDTTGTPESSPPKPSEPPGSGPAPGTVTQRRNITWVPHQHSHRVGTLARPVVSSSSPRDRRGSPGPGQDQDPDPPF
ncbi:MAG: DUF222 domain-containing protein [Micrococcaceae bacterium]